MLCYEWFFSFLLFFNVSKDYVTGHILIFSNGEKITFLNVWKKKDLLNLFARILGSMMSNKSHNLTFFFMLEIFQKKSPGY